MFKAPNMRIKNVFLSFGEALKLPCGRRCPIGCISLARWGKACQLLCQICQLLALPSEHPVHCIQVSLLYNQPKMTTLQKVVVFVRCGWLPN